jgi:hypothetical protein
MMLRVTQAAREDWKEIFKVLEYINERRSIHSEIYPSLNQLTFPSEDLLDVSPLLHARISSLTDKRVFPLDDEVNEVDYCKPHLSRDAEREELP